MAEPEMEVVKPQDKAEAIEVFRELQVEPPLLPLRVKFDPPIDYDGQVYTTIVLDFDRMNGKDFQRCERDFIRMYKADRNEIPLPEMKHLYHAIVASYLADVPVGLILKLPRRYYVPLRTEVLKACGGSTEAQEKEV
jgi:hypothetical protein